MILTATMTIITLPLGPHRYDEISKLCFQCNDSIAMFACCCNDSQCLYLRWIYMYLYESIWCMYRMMDITLDRTRVLHLTSVQHSAKKSQEKGKTVFCPRHIFYGILFAKQWRNIFICIEARIWGTENKKQWRIKKWKYDPDMSKSSKQD